MIIRPAEGTDAGAIADIANAVVRDTLVTFTTEERSVDRVFNDIKDKSGRFFVADQGGTVVGFATYGPFRNGPGYAATSEHSVLLAPEARGRGVGRALMEALQDAALRNGVHVLVAGISSANPGAVLFHKALGFREVGRMPEVGRKWDQWLDLILMQKNLSGNYSVAPDS